MEMREERRKERREERRKERRKGRREERRKGRGRAGEEEWNGQCSIQNEYLNRRITMLSNDKKDGTFLPLTL